MTYTAAPVLNGAALARPSAVDDGAERVGSSVQLAGGALRGYTAGSRRVIGLTWTKGTEATLLLIRAAYAARFASYVHSDGDAFVVEVEEPSAQPIAGTEPTRFAIAVTLREQGVR